MAAPVLLSRVGALQRVSLNRPAALNAINLETVHALTAALAGWRADAGVSAVLLRGEGKAFCAGGDIKALTGGTPAEQAAFFRAEYALDHALAVNARTQPHVAVFHGAVMGGGVGVSIHAPVRVVSERGVFAMPETAIGLIPDVGGSYFLPRLPMRFGHYLGLTGARLAGPELVHAGVATHFVPAERLPALEAQLAAALGDARLPPADALAAVRGAVGALAVPHAELPPFALSAEALRLIDAAFAQPTVEGVLQALRDHAPGGGGAAAAPPPPGSAADVAARTVAALERASPTSLKVTHAQLARGGRLTLAECFAMELRLVLRMLQRPSDFYEGVRALLVDKDNAPRWAPARLADVSDARVAALFAPLEGVPELELQ